MNQPEPHKMEKPVQEVIPVAPSVDMDSENSDRPEFSPYDIPACILEFGTDSPRSRYTVHFSFLEKSPKLISGLVTFSSNQIVEIHDVDKDVGHTLVHYLYYGTYQTLKQTGLSNKKMINNDYRRSVFTYCAAKAYDIEGLASLAMSKMQALGEKVTIYRFLTICSEAYPNISEDNEWFNQHLKSRIQTAFRRNSVLFTEDRFLDAIAGHAKLNRIVTKIMVEMLMEKITEATAKEESSAHETPAEEVSCEDVISLPESEDKLSSQKENETPFQPTAVEEVEVIETRVAEHAMEPEPRPAPIEEEPALPISKKKKKKMKKQALYDGEIADPSPPPPELLPEPEGQPIDPIDEVWGDSTSIASKSKKGKKGKKVNICPEPEPEPVPPIEDDWGFPSSFASTGKKKGKKAKKALPWPEPEPELAQVPEPETTAEAVADQDEWRPLTKKENRSHLEKELNPLNEQIKWGYSWGSWGFPSTTTRDAVAEGPACSSDPAPVETVGETEQVKTIQEPTANVSEADDWAWGIGSKSKKKKKGKGAGWIEETPAAEVTIEPEPKVLEDNTVAVDEPPIVEPEVPIEPEKEDQWGFWGRKREETPQVDEEPAPAPLEEPKPTEPTPAPPDEDTTVPERTVCRLRAKHLAGKGKGWKSCSKCRAMIREVVLELARRGSGNENEDYEIVDRIVLDGEEEEGFSW